MPAKMHFTVRRDKFSTAIRQNQQKALQVVGVYLTDEMKKVVSVPVKKVRRTRTRNTAAGKKGSTYLEVVERSKPGEPPRLDTGFGRSMIHHRVEQDGRGMWHLKISVHKNAWYMLFLEMKRNRPWLMATWLKHRDRIEQIIASFGKMVA